MKKQLLLLILLLGAPIFFINVSSLSNDKLDVTDKEPNSCLWHWHPWC